MPRRVRAAVRYLGLAAAFLLPACASITEVPHLPVAPGQAAGNPSASGSATSAPTPRVIVIGVEATPTPCTVDNILATWNLTRLAEQTVVIPVDETNVLSIRAEVAAGAGGVILFGSYAPANLGAQLQSLDAAAPGGLAPFIMTDEEGGVVQRMANLVGSIPAPRQMGATMSPAQIRQLATGLAQRMRASGVTMDLAPVLDVDGGQGPNNFDADGTRSFSANVGIASNDGVAFATGLLAGGVTPVVKHFPGLGGAAGNTDVVAAATLPWSQLQSGGLRPFEAAIAANVPAVMIANATVPGLSSLPASISPTVINGVLRQQLGFHGLVITDSLSAVAISSAGYSVPQAAVAALRAGADMVLYNAGPSSVAQLTDQTVAAIVAAVNTGALSRAALQSSVARVLAAKGVNLCAG
jgi:beta-N-acetylhexosaminidase